MLRAQRLLGIFESLAETEAYLDEKIKKKKMVVEEAHFKQIKRLIVVRVHITAERNPENNALFVLISGRTREIDSAPDTRASDKDSLPLEKEDESRDPDRKKADPSDAESHPPYSPREAVAQNDRTHAQGPRIPQPAEGEGVQEQEQAPLFGQLLRRLLVDLRRADPQMPSPDCAVSKKQADAGTWDSEKVGMGIPQRIRMDADTENTRGSPLLFEWQSAGEKVGAPVMEFEIKTKEETAAAGCVYISLLSYTGVYSVCEGLASAIGVRSGSKTGLLLGIWKYVTSQKLRDPKRPKVILCTPALEQVFGVKETSFAEIIDRLDEYICPLEMLSLPFEIPMGPGGKSQTAYDITVEVDPVSKEYVYANEKNISLLDKKINDIKLRLEKQNEKIEALSSFIADPKHFITEWILESSKNLHLLADDLYDVHDGFYVQKEIQESVYQMLQHYK